MIDYSDMSLRRHYSGFE